MRVKKFPCGVGNCKGTFRAPTAAGLHRRIKHSILGASPSAAAYRLSKEKKNGKLPTPREVKPTPKSKTITVSRPTSQTRQEREPIPEGALAVAFGRYQELCRSFAYEYDLPPKLFASRLTELISASAVR